MTDKNIVSIIIPCFNAVKYTRQCIDSVLKNSTYPYELILINNGSSDGTKKYFQRLNLKSKYLKKLCIIQLKSNYGVAKALNTGVAKSDGKYICYINNDVIVTKQWLEGLIYAINQHKNNAVAGTLFNPFENKVFVKKAEKNKKIIDIVADKTRLTNYHNVKEAKTVHGLCMFIKKSIFKKVGLFNENFYPCFGEDIEFCKRVKKYGYNLVDAADVFVFHYWNKSVRSDEFKKQNKNIETVMKNHYKKFKIPKKHKI
ncbi:MAG: glycosyltransferase family 2 protein [Endomicrobiaceae bacterium]|nr:glycosyltransferase family 2 protein [Endomicrobiaceae bacterium]